MSRKAQKLKFTLQMRNVVLHSIVRNCGTFLEKLICIELGVFLMGKGPHEPETAYKSIRIRSSVIYVDLLEYKNVGDTQFLSCAVLLSFQR